MQVAELIANYIVSEGVSLAAGMSGQQIGPFLDQIAGRDEIELMYTRQERVAFDICDGFARATGRPAVAFTDSGPAAANLMCGLVNSWGDSVPVLFIAGHNNAAEIASRQTKEIPFVDIFSPVSKWATVITHPSQTIGTLRRAFMHMYTGRQGPVVIGMPFDVAKMDVNVPSWVPISSQKRIRSGGDPSSIKSAIEMLISAKNPYVYVGAGILFSEASDELVTLSELLTLPVATTLNGKSAFPEEHPLSLGIGGFAQASYSSLPATKIANSADLILTIGCGFKRHATQVLPRKEVPHIQIDVDPKELNREDVAELAILGDSKVILGQLIAEAERQLSEKKIGSTDIRTSAVKGYKDEWAKICEPLLKSDEIPINPFRVTDTLSNLLDKENSILLHDAGTVRGTTSQHYMASKPRSFIGFGVESAMGWSLGAGMGAKKAHPKKLVVIVVGEEAFNETAMDVETSVRNSAPILIIVKNNRKFIDTDGGESSRLARVRFGTGVDIGSLCSALGAKTYEISDPSKLEDILKSAIETVSGGRTAVVEVKTQRVNASLHSLWQN